MFPQITSRSRSPFLPCDPLWGCAGANPQINGGGREALEVHRRRLVTPTGRGKCIQRRIRRGTSVHFETRLLTRLLEEVWFPAHACQCLVASLFHFPFRGEKGSGPCGGLGAWRPTRRSAAWIPDWPQLADCTHRLYSRVSPAPFWKHGGATMLQVGWRVPA